MPHETTQELSTCGRRTIPTDLPELIEAIILSNDQIEAELSHYRRLYDRLLKVEADYKATFRGGTTSNSSQDRRSVQNIERNLKISVRRALERAIRRDLTAEEALAEMNEAALESARERYGIGVPEGVQTYVESLYRRYHVIKTEKVERKRLNEFSAQ
jgi:hypothetical protein